VIEPNLDAGALAARAACRWAEQLPDIEMPDHSEFVRFAIVAGKPANLMRAIERCRKKARARAQSGEEEMPMAQALGYVLSICRSEAAGVRSVRPGSNRRLA
jgi:hypothetical protein